MSYQHAFDLRSLGSFCVLFKIPEDTRVDLLSEGTRLIFAVPRQYGIVFRTKEDVEAHFGPYDDLADVTFFKNRREQIDTTEGMRCMTLVHFSRACRVTKTGFEDVDSKDAKRPGSTDLCRNLMLARTSDPLRSAYAVLLQSNPIYTVHERMLTDLQHKDRLQMIDKIDVYSKKAVLSIIADFADVDITSAKITKTPMEFVLYQSKINTNKVSKGAIEKEVREHSIFAISGVSEDSEEEDEDMDHDEIRDTLLESLVTATAGIVKRATKRARVEEETMAEKIRGLESANKKLAVTARKVQELEIGNARLSVSLSDMQYKAVLAEKRIKALDLELERAKAAAAAAVAASPEVAAQAEANELLGKTVKDLVEKERISEERWAKAIAFFQGPLSGLLPTFEAAIRS